MSRGQAQGFCCHAKLVSGILAPVAWRASHVPSLKPLLPPTPAAHPPLHNVAPIAGRDPRWGRLSETWGEDPLLQSRLAVAFVRGLQGGPRPRRVAVGATCKHFLGHDIESYEVGAVHSETCAACASVSGGGRSSFAPGSAAASCTAPAAWGLRPAGLSLQHAVGACVEHAGAAPQAGASKRAGIPACVPSSTVHGRQAHSRHEET